jgi:hypothetical protein
LIVIEPNRALRGYRSAAGNSESDSERDAAKHTTGRRAATCDSYAIWFVECDVPGPAVAYSALAEEQIAAAAAAGMGAIVSAYLRCCHRAYDASVSPPVMSDFDPSVVAAVSNERPAGVPCSLLTPTTSRSHGSNLQMQRAQSHHRKRYCGPTEAEPTSRT